MPTAPAVLAAGFWDRKCQVLDFMYPVTPIDVAPRAFVAGSRQADANAWGAAALGFFFFLCVCVCVFFKNK